MSSLFWISFLIVLYTYLGYPALMVLLARLRPKPWKRTPFATRVSVVMAVHNGAALLPWKLEHLLTLEPELIKEIIVVSDGSTDGTEQILSAVTDARFRSILLPEQAGKTSAVNRAVAAATGDVLLFTDIRPKIEPGAVAALVSNFADPSVGCVAGELIVRSSAAQEATAAAVGGLYWRYEQAIRDAEAAVDSPVGVYGGFYAVRRELVTPAPEGLILDDMFQPLAIIRRGFRSVIDRNAVVVDAWPAKTGAEFDRKVRTLAGNFQLLARAPWVLNPAMNRTWFQLVSHKLLRLVVPYCFVLMLLSAYAMATHSLGWMVFAALQTIFWLAAALSLRVKLPVVDRIAAPAGALLVLNAAAVVGLYRALFTHGPLWKIWMPTAAPTGNTYIHDTQHRRA